MGRRFFKHDVFQLCLLAPLPALAISRGILIYAESPGSAFAGCRKKCYSLVLCVFFGFSSFNLGSFDIPSRAVLPASCDVAVCDSFRSLRVYWRGMWWVTHTYACGGLSVLSCSSSSPLPGFCPLLLLSLSLCLSSLASATSS